MAAEQDMRALISEIFEEVFNKQQLDKIDRYFAEEFVEHAAIGDLQGREAFRQYAGAWLAGFPDGHTEVSDIVIDGDLGYWTVRFTGTNTGEFNGIPATGRKVDVIVINKGRVRDGLAVEHWTGNDALQMMQQLGLMPEQAGAPA
jgi:predicted ester cyclase